jgi:deazaflavin-dependent oxidoreductase (nitroreductase family)
MPVTGEYEPSTSQWARDQAELYESSGGTEGTMLHGRPVIILTSKGAKTGKVRKTALMRVEHDGQYAAIASKGGAPEHPFWYYNLVANPLVELQDGPTKRDYLAHLATGVEREQWWQRSVDAFPNYAGYQEKTDREIPVFILVPQD